MRALVAKRRDHTRSLAAEASGDKGGEDEDKEEEDEEEEEESAGKERRAGPDLRTSGEMAP